MHQRRRRLFRLDNPKSGRLGDTPSREVQRTHPYRRVLLLHFHHRAATVRSLPFTTILSSLCTTSALPPRSVLHHRSVSKPFTLFTATNYTRWPSINSNPSHWHYSSSRFSGRDLHPFPRNLLCCLLCLTTPLSRWAPR